MKIFKSSPYISAFVALIVLTSLASCSGGGGCGNCTVPAYNAAAPTPLPPGVTPTPTPLPPGVTPTPLPPGVTPTPTPTPIPPPVALSCAANAVPPNQGVPLGNAFSFAVLAGTANITNTSSIPNPTNITGDIGVSPGTAIVGFPPGNVIGGGIFANVPPAIAAHADAGTAFNNAAGRASTGTVPGDLAGLTIVPGVYTAAAVSVGIGANGTVTLDAQGNPNAVWIFQIPSSTLTANVGSRVLLAGLANPCNIFWEVGSSATLNGPIFAGNVIAFSSISVGSNVVMTGRLIAVNTAVTLISDTITRPNP